MVVVAAARVVVAVTFMVVNVGVLVRLIVVFVPTITCEPSPALNERFDDDRLRFAKTIDCEVVVPVPPIDTGKTLVL